MTREEREHEKALAALVRANAKALAAADAVARANAGHIAISKANFHPLTLTVDPAERRHAEMLEAIQSLKPKPRPTNKDIITGEALKPPRKKPIAKRERLEKFFKSQIKALAKLREKNYYSFRDHLNKNTKQSMASQMKMPDSTFGRLVNGSTTLRCLCAAVMDEKCFNGYLGIHSRVV